MMRLVLGKDPHREERHVEIRLKEQVARVYDAMGTEIFSTKVSTGRKGYCTPTGDFVPKGKNTVGGGALEPGPNEAAY